MPLHPQAAALLEIIGGGPPLADQPVAQNRADLEQAIPLTGERTDLHAVDDLVISAPHGTIPVRLYRTQATPQPVLVYFHGGGWVLGDLEIADTTARDIAAAGNIAVLSVDYRLAPEHTYPAAHVDAVAATRAVLSGDVPHVDPLRVAVGGDSAGGNLAAHVAQELRHESALRHQVLVYPVTQADVGSTSSYREFDEGYFLTGASMRYFFDTYAPGSALDDARLAPASEPDLRGLPPATVITAEFDPLRDEGEAYAKALEAAGVVVELRRFDGQFHPFLYLAGAVDAAAEARRFVGGALHRALSGAA
ncbi:alpha/beta hydrolase [Actinomycetospora callitridis]|uniref:alpha/beta hydrolase n=1 Tax=Actinomycetospora callitridis TaxID=913944 RepID=UPI0023657F28|nr:alpha/beta hydrolase [Actinomycetospora callitridis]MDD7921445.1 alpha/beta hydrolase [Actinomycetospora callitridis]